MGGQEAVSLAHRTASPNIPSLSTSATQQTQGSRVAQKSGWWTGTCLHAALCRPPLCASPPHQNAHGAPAPRPHAGGSRSPMVGTSLHLHSPLRTSEVQVPTLALLPTDHAESQARAGGACVCTGRAGAGDQLIPGEKHWPRLWTKQGQGVL